MRWNIFVVNLSVIPTATYSCIKSESSRLDSTYVRKTVVLILSPQSNLDQVIAKAEAAQKVNTKHHVTSSFIRTQITTAADAY